MRNLPLPSTDWALFLDVDGTLVALAEHPDQVRPAPGLASILQQVASTLDGALALVTGRTIDAVDHMLGATGLAIAGQHGQHIRAANGQVLQAPPATAAMADVHDRANALACDYPALWVEEKTSGVAIHYRQAPAAADEVRAFGEAIAADFADMIDVLNGKAVVEIKPAGYDKGSAVDTLMRQPPFTGRRPIFVGDDITDEDGFRVANAAGGESIRVPGHEHSNTDYQTAAQYEIANVDEVNQWLCTLPQAIKTTAT